MGTLFESFLIAATVAPKPEYNEAILNDDSIDEQRKKLFLVNANGAWHCAPSIIHCNSFLGKIPKNQKWGTRFIIFRTILQSFDIIIPFLYI